MVIAIFYPIFDGGISQSIEFFKGLGKSGSSFKVNNRDEGSGELTTTGANEAKF